MVNTVQEGRILLNTPVFSDLLPGHHQGVEGSRVRTLA